ncbi:MAG: PadR family transcriptional regulator [Sphingomonas sp.]|nr:PadR family transcriptional regulator [Sphingomonas sp.]
MTPLSYALLGLVQMQPRSGYALRKVFETTPLGGYSSSPGSIYPALKSLEKAGLLVTRASPGGRGKGLYHLTAEGGRLLEAWLAAPIGDLGEAMLRFAFLRDDDRDAILAFLDAFQSAAEGRREREEYAHQGADRGGAWPAPIAGVGRLGPLDARAIFHRLNREGRDDRSGKGRRQDNPAMDAAGGGSVCRGSAFLPRFRSVSQRWSA